MRLVHRKFYFDHSGFESQKAFQSKLLIVLFYVMFVCKCVLYYCHQVSTQLQLINISISKSTAKWETSDFQRGQIVGARLAGGSVIKMATLWGVSRAAVSMVMETYTDHGRTSSAKRNSGQKPKLSERDRRTLKRIVSVNHRRTAEFKSWRPFPQKQSDESFTNPPSMVELQLVITENSTKGEKYGQMSHPSRSRHQTGFMFGHHPRKPLILNAWFQLWNMEPDLWWFGQ